MSAPTKTIEVAFGDGPQFIGATTTERARLGLHAIEAVWKSGEMVMLRSVSGQTYVATVGAYKDLIKEGWL